MSCRLIRLKHQNDLAAVRGIGLENLRGQFGIIGHIGGYRFAEAVLAPAAGRSGVIELLFARLAQVVGRARTAQIAILDQHLDAAVRIDAVSLLCEDADADMRRLEIDPQPADFSCGDKLLWMFRCRGVPADDRVDLLVAIDLLALVLVESASQQFDVLCVFGEFDAVFFAAFDYAPVLEVDAPLNGILFQRVCLGNK